MNLYISGWLFAMNSSYMSTQVKEPEPSEKSKYHEIDRSDFFHEENEISEPKILSDC